MPDVEASEPKDWDKPTPESLRDRLPAAEALLFPASRDPVVSIILVARGEPDHLLPCLEGIAANGFDEYEIVIVHDDAYAIRNPLLLDRLRGVRRCRLRTMDSLAQAWNLGARASGNPFLLFLEDDARLQEGFLESLLRCFRLREQAGAVGGMVVDSEGTLLEAGSLLSASAHWRPVGRGWNPDDYRVQYRRTAAFCSSVGLGMRRTVFQRIGGFSERYSNDCYRDADLGLRIRASGWETVYDPSMVLNRLGKRRGVSDPPSGSLEEDRRTLLQGDQRNLLETLPEMEAYPDEVFFEMAKGKRILWIEDAPPFPKMGAGFPRTRAMLGALIELGHAITLLPTFIASSDFSDVYKDTPRDVEVALGIGYDGFDRFWRNRNERYDAVIISRPNNLKRLGETIFDTRRSRSDLRVIYDAEAIFANREINRRKVDGPALSAEGEKALLEEELGPALHADAVLAISDGERSQFQALGFPRIHMLRHHSRIAPTPNDFQKREGILFVGAVHSDSAPNAHGLIDFIEHSLPELRKRMGMEIPLYCAGEYHSERLLRYASDRERFLGFVDDLDEWYGRCRLFIAPARFAAGIPLKVVEAASRGIPVVGSELARSQLGWTSDEMASADRGREFAIACQRVYTDKELWTRLRNGALDRVRREYSHAHIVEALGKALAD